MENTVLNTIIKEKREHKRLNGNFRAKIITPTIGERELFCKNISEGGTYIEISFNKFDSPPPDILITCLKYESIFLQIKLGDEDIKVPGVIRWTKKINAPSIHSDLLYGIGVEFIEKHPEQIIKIQKYFIQTKEQKPSIQSLLTFPLLINGEEIDTGKYEYQPYIDKLLTEPNYASLVLKNLKQGLLVDNYNNFVYGRYCIGNDKYFQDAIKSAYEASLIYKTFDVDRRTKIIIDIHNKLLKYKDEFIELLAIEGHPKRLAEWELSGMLKGTDPETVHFYRMNLETFVGHDKKEKIFLYRKPDGVVCLETPKNAPSSISVIGIFALMAGNTVIVKPPLSIPISTIYFWKDIVYRSALENGAPPGVVNVIIGNSEKILQSWLNSPLVNDIIYIGNTKKGLEVGKQIYMHGKKPILELSGNDKLFVWKDAPLDNSTDTLLECFYGSSQICMVPKMAFIHQEIFNEFIEMFMEKVKALKPGPPSDPYTILTPVGKRAEFNCTLEDALRKGGRLLCGGNRINHFGIQDDNGIFIQPTIVMFEDKDISSNILCLTEENFFPLLPIVKVSGKNDKEIFDKMIKFTELDNYGLRISIWALSENYIDKFITNINPGGIIRINSSHVGFSLYLSNNGGTGKSGGPFGEMSYIWQKTSHLQGVSITSL